MRDWVINKPHLQSRQQKIGSFCIAALSWLLWLYFLLPLFTLGGWLMGVKSLSAEIRWFGGYKTLLELLQMYGYGIALIALFWCCWSLCTSRRKPKALSEQKQLPLDDQKLCASFQISLEQLQQARAANRVTICFDDAGNIIGISSAAPGNG